MITPLYGWSPTPETVLIIAWILLWAWTVYLYSAADRQRRDLLTDMTQLIHDGKVEGDDLRRARDIPEIEDRINRRERD